MKNKSIVASIVLAGCFLFGFLLFGARAADNPISPQVEIQPGFNDQYKEYLKNMAPPTFLNGKPSSDLKEVFASYQMPFSVLKIDFKNNPKSVYFPGQKINVSANLSYQYKGDVNMKKIKEACMKNLKDENGCSLPEPYKIPEFNDLGVYVQVWRKDDNEENAKKGDYLVDEFYALENQSLSVGNANNNKDFNISWTIPKEQKGGGYYVLLYLNQNKSFDLLGTPLAPSSEGKRFDFEIDNKNAAGVEIDKDNIKINDAEYVYRMPAPTVKGNEIKIEVPIKNLSGTIEPTVVKYKLYRWGRTNSADSIDSKTENKSVAVGTKDTLNYSFTPNDTDSVYDLKITAETNTSKSATYVRFIVEGKNRGIFRFLAFAEANGGLVPMFCMRNANWSGEFPGKVKLTLGDAVWEKEGKMVAGEGNCFIVQDDKFKLTNSKCTQLKGEIIDQNGKTVDSKEVSVNCQPKNENLAVLNKISGGGWAGWLFFGLIGLIAVIIVISIYLNNKKNKLTS